MSRSSKKDSKPSMVSEWFLPVVIVVSVTAAANWFPRSGEGTTFGQFMDGWNGVSDVPAVVEPEPVVGGEVR